MKNCETYEEAFTPELIQSLEKDGMRVPAKEEMTCTTCPSAKDCDLAWDLYNTDGDCLMDK